MLLPLQLMFVKMSMTDVYSRLTPCSNVLEIAKLTGQEVLNGVLCDVYLLAHYQNIKSLTRM